MPGLGFKNSQALATGFRCQEMSICELITIVHNPRLVLEVEKGVQWQLITGNSS